jgi:hypothetical protein
MRVPWKLVGLAGVAGVAATGVVLVRKHRAQREYDPDDLRERLHSRLSEVSRHGSDGYAPPEERDATAPDDIPDLT